MCIPCGRLFSYGSVVTEKRIFKEITIAMDSKNEEILEYKTQAENQVIYLAKKYALETAMKETGLSEECFDVEVIQTPEEIQQRG